MHSIRRCRKGIKGSYRRGVVQAPRYTEDVHRAELSLQEGGNVLFHPSSVHLPVCTFGGCRSGAGKILCVDLTMVQGPVLEREDLPLGVVSAIAGQTRLWVVVKGMAVSNSNAAVCNITWVC